MSFDEDEDSIIKSARSIGMDLEQFSQNVQVFRLEAEEVRNSLTRIERFWNFKNTHRHHKRP